MQTRGTSGRLWENSTTHYLYFSPIPRTLTIDDRLKEQHGPDTPPPIQHCSWGDKSTAPAHFKWLCQAQHRPGFLASAQHQPPEPSPVELHEDLYPINPHGGCSTRIKAHSKHTRFTHRLGSTSANQPSQKQCCWEPTVGSNWLCTGLALVSRIHQPDFQEKLALEASHLRRCT